MPLSFVRNSDGSHGAMAAHTTSFRRFRCYRSGHEWRAEVYRETDKFPLINVDCKTLKAAKDQCEKWRDKWMENMGK